MKVGETYSTLAQFIEVWRLHFAAVTANIAPAQIIGTDEDDVWFRSIKILNYLHLNVFNVFRFVFLFGLNSESYFCILLK